MGRRRLSVCIIAKNEKENLPRCLGSVGSVADEIIVVDTGSSDGTAEVARSLGAKVVNFDWNDDFSAARNRCLQEASGEWILQLDADEELEEGSREALQYALGDKSKMGYLLTIVNLTDENRGPASTWTFPSLRLFRNQPKHRYTGIVHEQIQLPFAGPGKVGVAEVRLVHYGYLPRHLDEKAKSRRNIELIRKALEKEPLDSYNNYALANEYFAKGDFTKALEYYGNAYATIKPPLPLYYPKLLRNLVSCLRELGRWQESIEAAEIAQRDFADYTDLEFLKGLNYLEHEQFDRAISAFARCLELGEAAGLYDTQPGVGGWRALLGLGIAYERKGQDAKAVRFLEQALEGNRSDPVAAGHLARVLGKQNSADQVWEELEKKAELADAGVRDAIEEALRTRE